MNWYFFDHAKNGIETGSNVHSNINSGLNELYHLSNNIVQKMQ